MYCEIREEEYQSTLRVTQRPQYTRPQTPTAHSSNEAHRTRATQLTQQRRHHTMKIYPAESRISKFTTPVSLHGIRQYCKLSCGVPGGSLKKAVPILPLLLFLPLQSPPQGASAYTIPSIAPKMTRIYQWRTYTTCLAHQ